MIVLLPDPAFAAQIRRPDQCLECGGDINRRLVGARLELARVATFHEWPPVDRRLVAKFLDRQVGDHRAAMAHDKALVGRGLADHREIETPFAEDRLRLLLFVGLEHHEHALLAL